MRRNVIAAIVFGVLIGVGLLIAVLVLDDARYEYRNAGSFPGQELNRMIRSGTACMPMTIGDQLWFRCPRLHVFD